MDTPWIELGGVAVRAPVTAGTNLLLSLQCCVFFAQRRRATSRRVERWSGFFAMMALATLAGVFKHGARHVLSVDELTATLAVSNLASAAAIWMAQEATIASHAPPGPGLRLQLLADAQLALFVAINIIWGPEIAFLMANTALGLLPVIVVETFRREAVGGAGMVAGGLAFSLLTGLVYVGEISLGRWFNHIDVAHLVMGVSFYLIHRGLSRSGSTAWS